MRLPIPSLPLLPTFLLLAMAPALPTQAQWLKKRQDAPQPTPMPIHRPAEYAASTTMPNPFTTPQAALTAMPVAGPGSEAPLQTPASRRLPETVVFRQPPDSPPSYELPHPDFEYERRGTRPRGGFFGAPKPSEEMIELLGVIRDRAEHISRFGLPYVFGGDHPNEGGLDCSGAMKFLLSDLGFRDMPRTSYDQYAWLRKARTLRHSKSIPDEMGGRKGLNPGDLIFWGGTYDSGHKVSHVMIYLGQGRDGTHYMFGARGKNKTGLHGSGVDVFRLESGYQKGLIGYGSLPGVF
jgi:hypothetical protein